MSEPEEIGYNEQYARQIESELAATPQMLWMGGGIFLVAVAVGAFGYFQEDGSIFFLVALSLMVGAMLPLCWASGNMLWGGQMQADADRARETERRLAAREAALREWEDPKGRAGSTPASHTDPSGL